jgi:hypothetical protein
MNKLLVTLLLLLIVKVGLGQKNSEEFRKQILTNEYIAKTDIKSEFIKYDISTLLTQTRNSRVFGFIGDNYQRLRIILISVIKNKENPSQYFVYGKSMVKDNTCDFQGTINITNVFYFKNSDSPEIKQGKVVGDYLFYENPQQKHVGQFKGVFSSNWYIDKEGNLKYDDLSDVADGFTNNEFVGTWTNYSGTITKICNWGDGRIPMSGDLDDGTGEFHPSNKYQASGWLTYDQAYSGGIGKDREEEARIVEQKEWWK